MDWTKHYDSEWVVYRVNPRTWADDGVIDRVQNVSVTCSSKGVIQAGSIDVDGEPLDEAYYRLVLYAGTSGTRERFDIVTLKCVSSSGSYKGGSVTTKADAKSVLYPASTNRLEHGSYAPAGIDGIAFVVDMLSRVLDAPVRGVGWFTLDQPIVFDLDKSVLDACWLVLDAGNACIQIDGHGDVTVTTMPTEPSLVLDDDTYSMLDVSSSYSVNLASVPNRYVAVSGTEVVVAENSNPLSPVSTVSRGYYNDKVDKSPKRINGETLTAYAERRLRELSTIKRQYTYKREYWPDITVYSVIRANVDELGLVGDMRVTKQSYSIGEGIVVSETAEVEEVLI